MKANSYSFFKNKKIIITGHTGFKGSWLSLYLTNLGAKVYGISKNIPTNPSHYKDINLGKKIQKSIFADINNKKKLISIFKKIKPDLVFHLAAQAIVKKSFEDPYLTWQTNTIGTLNLLEALRFLNTKKTVTTILITSDKVYKNVETKRAYTEKDLLGGLDPYGGSKSGAELVIQSYVKSFFNKKNSKVLIGIARAGNVIGGGDWSNNRLIPDCARSWLKKQPTIIRSPNSTRPWQHVLDVISGYVDLAMFLKKNKYFHGQAFNFGPQSKNFFKVIDVLKILKFYWPVAKWQIIKKKNFKESILLNLNSSKSKKYINWKPILSIKDSLKLTIDWYKNYSLKNENIYLNTLTQIISYNEKKLYILKKMDR